MLILEVRDKQTPLKTRRDVGECNIPNGRAF
jgi:hypothetical protein